MAGCSSAFESSRWDGVIERHNANPTRSNANHSRDRGRCRADRIAARPNDHGQKAEHSIRASRSLSNIWMNASCRLWSTTLALATDGKRGYSYSFICDPTREKFFETTQSHFAQSRHQVLNLVGANDANHYSGYNCVHFINRLFLG